MMNNDETRFEMSGSVARDANGAVNKLDIKTIDIMPPVAVGKSISFLEVARAHAERLSNTCPLLRTRVNEDGMIVLDPKPVAPSVDYVDPEGNTHVHIHLIPEPIGDTLPGWYYSDECQILNGPYNTLAEAEAELDSYVKHLNKECGYNFNVEP